MLFSLLAIAIGLGVYFGSGFEALMMNSALGSSWVYLFAGTVFLFLWIFLNIQVIAPIQQLEQKLVPNLISLVKRDLYIRWGGVWLLFFSFVSYVISLFLSSHTESINFLGVPSVLPLVWLVCLGISLDVIKGMVRRYISYFNPFDLIQKLHSVGKNAMRTNQDPVFLQTVEELFEISYRSVEKSRLTVAAAAISQLPSLLTTFFSNVKSLSHSDRGDALLKGTGFDEASFTVYYFMQRLDQLFDLAASRKFQALCSQIVMALGKMMVSAAACDISLLSFPARTMGGIARKSSAAGLYDVEMLTTTTLLELSKKIVQDNDLTYSELQEPFLTIIDDLDAVSKDLFKRNKMIPTEALTQPLRDFRKIFEQEKMANHRDTPVILQRVDQLIAEYEMLDQVMKTMPSLADIAQKPDETSSV